MNNFKKKWLSKINLKKLGKKSEIEKFPLETKENIEC